VRRFRMYDARRLPPEAEIAPAIPPEVMPHKRACYHDRRGNYGHSRRAAYRIRGICVSRRSHHNADSHGGVCLMRGHCQHAQQRDYGKSDFLKHLFHPPIHSTPQRERST
jgi:hypothetical protein